MTAIAPSEVAAPNSRSMTFYRAAWRWHFYAGLFVIPFLLMLSLTGLTMVFRPQLENLQYGSLLNVAPQSMVYPLEAQKLAVKQAFPNGEISRVQVTNRPDRSTAFAVTNKGQDLNVYVNPYTNKVLGSVANDNTLYAIADKIHGTLLLGETGDRLVEIAAGWAIVLTITGLYLWWPRRGKEKRNWRAAFVPERAKGRSGWKNAHSVVGFWISGILLFFLLSGMAWTGIWGGKFVQAWNTFPANKWNNVPKSTQTLDSLNRPGEKVIPWNLEQTPIPQSGSAAGAIGVAKPVTLDSVAAFARAKLPAFSISSPSDAKGVYTVSASTMSGDVTDARKDLTLHIDQYSGKVLANVGWAEYNLGAKAMASGIALHQGRYGLWNQLLGAAFCLLILFICSSGVVMWWLRRPAGAKRLHAPPMPNVALWRGGAVIMLLLGLAFPLVGATLLTVLLLDLLVLRRVPVVKTALN